MHLFSLPTNQEYIDLLFITYTSRTFCGLDSLFTYINVKRGCLCNHNYIHISKIRDFVKSLLSEYAFFLFMALKLDYKISTEKDERIHNNKFATWFDY